MDIELKEQRNVPVPLEKAFDLVSDFSFIQEWDPGVASSVKVTPGKIEKGSRFDLVLRFGPFRPEMSYEIVEYDPPFRVVLAGEADSFKAFDEIRFEENGGSTKIDYHAVLTFKKISKRYFTLFKPLMKRVGRKAMDGLEAALSQHRTGYDEKSLFRSGSGLLDWICDHMILPGALGFTTIGYSLMKLYGKPDLSSLEGRIIVITGATSGIGKAAALELAQRKADLTMIVRNEKKARNVCREIIDRTANENVRYLIADLGLMSDVRRVADKLKSKMQHIDVLINNAGALFNSRNTTAEGLDNTFATDLLSVYFLTESLMPLLESSEDGRIVTVSSGGMYTQGIDLDDLQNGVEPYSGAAAYARAKRGGVMLTEHWARKMQAKRVSFYAMHPGWVDTPGIERSLPVFHQRVNRVLRTPQQGADTIVWLASAKRAGENSGLFWLYRRPHETVLFPGTGESRQERQQLWNRLNRFISER